MQGPKKNTPEPRLGHSIATNLSATSLSLSLSYKKVNKLITALFMVTDIMEIDEPLRSKLRTLGTEIVSDVHSTSHPMITDGVATLSNKISATISLLEIASAINLITQMNYAILNKELVELRGALVDLSPKINLRGNDSIEELFKEEEAAFEMPQKSHRVSIGRAPIGQRSTRLGLQKATTLMQALSDKMPVLSNIKISLRTREGFDILKQQRRGEIIKVIKNNPNGMTITDIKVIAGGALASVGDKTLQRELVSMVKESVLQRTGSKRWSRYFLPK